MTRMLVALAALVLAVGTDANGCEPMIDAHAHYSAEDTDALTPAQIVATLDAAGIEKIVVTSSPAQRVQQLYRFAPDRIVPLLGVYASDRDKATWMRDTALPGRVATQLQAGTWAGLGELHLFAHDADAQVFEQLVRLAAQHRLVLLLHGDEVVIERAFEIEPTLRVLWAHLGTDPAPDRLASMLERFPNLWIDTSVRDERIAPAGVLRPEWHALFARHPDRFVVAVDTFSLNRWQQYAEVAARIRRWTAPLPDTLRARLLHDNAARLFDGFRPPPARP